jgi:hypothetical protein
VRKNTGPMGLAMHTHAVLRMRIDIFSIRRYKGF